jgi:hypothetical protein
MLRESFEQSEILPSVRVNTNQPVIEAKTAIIFLI